MASLYGTQSSKGWYLRLDYNVTQNVEANKSTIACTLYVYDATGSSWNEYPNEAYYKIYNSGAIYQIYNFGSTGLYTLGSYSFTVDHEADGSKEIALTAEWCSENPGSAYTPYLLTLNEIVTLPTIPRATKVGVKTKSLIIGKDYDITLNRYLENVTHNLSYVLNGKTVEIESGVTGEQISWRVPYELLDEMPNSTSTMGYIVCETYSGETLVGSTRVAARFLVGDQIVPEISALEVSFVNENEWLAEKKLCVEGYTKIRVCTTAVGGRGSTVSSISISGIGTGEGEDWTSNVLTAGTKTVTVRVKDTRGRETLERHELLVKAYAKPVVTQLAYERGSYENEVWAASVSGKDVKITCETDIHLSDDGNVARLNLTLLKEGETNPAEIYADSDADGVENYYVKGVETDKTCVLIATVTDSLGNLGTKRIELSTAEVPLNINFETLGICVGGVAEKEKTFQIKWPVDMDKNTISNLAPAVEMGDALQKGYVFPIEEGGTGATTKAGAMNNLGALSLNEIVDEDHTIAETADLDEFVNPGSFCCATSVIAKTLNNAPSYTDAGFRLTVSCNNHSDSVVQVISFDSTDGRIFYRVRSEESVWGQWKEFASTSSAPAKHSHYKYLGVGTAGYGSTFTLSNSDDFTLFCAIFSYNGWNWTGILPAGNRVAVPVYGDYWPFTIAKSGSNISVSGPGDESFYVYVYGIV